MRFHGVLAPNAKLRPLVVPVGPPALRTPGADEDEADGGAPPKHSVYILWARLLAA